MIADVEARQRHVISPREASVGRITKHKTSKTNALVTSIHIQAKLLVDIEAKETKPLERARSALAWLEHEKLKRVIRMQPNPKAVDVSPKQRKPGSSQAGPSFSEAPKSKTEDAQIAQSDAQIAQTVLPPSP